jgi:hypothetical protein
MNSTLEGYNNMAGGFVVTTCVSASDGISSRTVTATSRTPSRAVAQHRYSS